MSTTRRSFLKTTVLGAGALSAAGVFAQESSGLPGKSEVIVGKGTAEAILPKIFDKLGGIGQFVKQGSRVIIKPNMSFANAPEMATTTSPEAVAALAKLCLDAGAKRVIVCDNTLREAELCKEKTGIAAAVSALKGVAVFTPQAENLFEEKTSDKAKVLTRAEVVKELARADAYFSIPAAKSHSAGGISLNLKGQMGMMRDRQRMHSEMDLHEAIAELLYYMKPTVSFVDATRALLDNGPSGPGTVVTLNTFVGGLDPVAVDSYAVTLASWYGKKYVGTDVKHLKYAAELGLGNVESSKITEISV
jgi:uncharacterized protein (DUF362 family)